MLLISDVSSKALNDAEGCRVQKWEYLVVEQAGDKWNYDADNDWRMGSSNDLLKDLGREGWELIGVIPIPIDHAAFSAGRRVKVSSIHCQPAKDWTRAGCASRSSSRASTAATLASREG
jgi:hypothetical protein